MKKTLVPFAAAVAVTVLASIASAQPMRMNMNVPVAFRTANAQLTEGRYQVLISSMAGGSPMVLFRNEGNGQVAASGAMRLSSAVRTDHAIVKLACIRKSCYLESITRGSTEYSFTTRRLTADEKRELYTMIIPIAPVPDAE